MSAAKKGPRKRAPTTRPRFVLRMGIPEMQKLWETLARGRRSGTLSGEDDLFADRLGKALQYLRDDPFHPGLESHEIAPLSARFGQKVFQSYIENNSERSWRMFWTYGPATGEITALGVEPHPEDRKSRGYDRVRLSALPARSGTP